MTDFEFLGVLGRDFKTEGNVVRNIIAAKRKDFEGEDVVVLENHNGESLGPKVGEKAARPLLLFCQSDKTLRQGGGDYVAYFDTRLLDHAEKIGKMMFKAIDKKGLDLKLLRLEPEGLAPDRFAINFILDWRGIENFPVNRGGWRDEGPGRLRRGFYVLLRNLHIGSGNGDGASRDDTPKPYAAEADIRVFYLETGGFFRLAEGHLKAFGRLADVCDIAAIHPPRFARARADDSWRILAVVLEDLGDNNPNF